MRRRITGLVVIGLLSSTAAWAQNAAFQGTVTDSSGGVLPGVTVEAASPALIEQSRTMITDEAGLYKIIDLRPGTYTLTFTLTGFQIVKRENIALPSGFTATVNISLPLGSLEESVTVSGESPIVDVVNTRVQSVIDQTLVSALPVGKNVGAFAALIPGAVGTQDVGGNRGETGQSFSIHGGSTDFQQFRDGMNTNSLLAAGNILSSANPSMIEEVVIETGGYDGTAQSGGGHINMVGKEGGNAFRGIIRADFANKSMQSSNVDDGLRARGVSRPGDIRQRYDVNGSVGGPILQNKLWFVTGLRSWATSTYQLNNYFNKTQGTLLYTPDLSRPAYDLWFYRTSDTRVTWQATPRNKFTGSLNMERDCACFFGLSGNTAPEAAGDHFISPDYRIQATWTMPVTSRLLVWAGMTYQYFDMTRRATGTGQAADRVVLESSNNYRYGGFGSQIVQISNTLGVQQNKMANENVTVSYIKGGHSFTVGAQIMQGIQDLQASVADGITYVFRNGVPQSINQFAIPHHWNHRNDYYGLFAGDQWKIGNFTLNLAARFDQQVGSVPSQHLDAGPFVPARDFQGQKGYPNFKDVMPRVGVAYDPFGNGKTAIKASWNRNVIFDTPAGLVQQLDPINLLVLSVNRTWSVPGFSAVDAANGQFRPTCDLTNQASQTVGGQTCGPITNANFGKPAQRTTTFTDDTYKGWYKRRYTTQTSVSLQQELMQGLSVNVGYFRTTYGNFTLTDNLEWTPDDFSPYSITTPVDPRLPGGGGQLITGLYNVNPDVFNKVNNLIVPASTFGKQTRVYNGIDATMLFRRSGYFLSGGLSTGGTTTDRCFVVDSPQELYHCRVEEPWSSNTQVKFQGVAPLPWDFQLSGNFQMLPSIQSEATLQVSNASIQPSLGRPLSSCPATGTCNATVNIPIIHPETVFNEGWNRQTDLRVSRKFQLGRASFQANLDVFNAFNGNSVLTVNNTYGRSWNNALSILAARTVKLSGEIKF